MLLLKESLRMSNIITACMRMPQKATRTPNVFLSIHREKKRGAATGKLAREEEEEAVEGEEGCFAPSPASIMSAEPAKDTSMAGRV